MSRRRAGALLVAASIAALAASDAVPLSLPAGCLLWLGLRVVLFDRFRFELPEVSASLIQVGLALLFLWLGILREPPMDPVAGLLALCTPLLVLRTHLRRTPFNEYLEIVLALLIMVGSAAIAPGWRPLGIVAGWMGVAGAVLPGLVERAGGGRDRTGTRIRVVRPAGSGRAAAAAAGVLLALGGVVVGSVFWLTVPRLSAAPGLPDDVDEEVLARRQVRRGTPGWIETVARIGFPRELHIGDLGRIKRHEGVAFLAALRLHGRPWDPGRYQESMLLLRARGWDVYDPARRRWTASGGGRRPVPRDGTLAEAFAPLHYEISLRGYDGRTLFLPQRATRVLGASRRLLRDTQDGVHSVSPLRAYAVEAAVPVTHPVDVRRLEPDPAAPAVLHTVPPALRDALAARLPSVEPGRVAVAVEAFRAWLARERFRYTLVLPDTLPADTDPVVAFLDRREGHCELYASAACFFLRLHGLPARVVAGVRCSERIERGVYRARMRNAHAWVEVACRDVGFVAFDFTPADTAAAPADEADAVAAADGAEGAAAEGAAPAGIDWSNPFRYGRLDQERLVGWAGERLGPFARDALPLAAAAGLLLVVVTSLRRRARRPGARGRIGRGGAVPGRVLAFYRRWLRRLAARGHRRRPAQTPREFLASLPRAEHESGRRVTSEFERRRYG